MKAARNIVKLVFVCAIVLCVLCASAFAADITANPNASAVYVNGEQVRLEAYTIEQNNYFKLRDLAYVLSGTEAQFDVTWDQQKFAINLLSGEPYTIVGGEMNAAGGTGNASAVLSASAIYLDEEAVTLKAYTIRQNNYFKLRDLGEALDFGVSWDQQANAIYVDTTKGYGEEEEPEDPADDGPVKIVLDAGHGGKDVGAVGTVYQTDEAGNPTEVYETYYEKDAALAITHKLGQLLEGMGMEVVYTREEDTYPSLAERVETANDCEADYYISIHLNSVANSPEVSGTETLIYGTGGEAEKLAERIQAQIVEDTGSRNRGVKVRSGLYVLKHTDMPAVLVETGFISNEEECLRLFDETYQMTMAQAIADAVGVYLGV